MPSTRYIRALVAESHIRILKVVLPFAVGSALLVPVPASAHIYKWLDEKGTTVFSNTLPTEKAKATQVEVVIEEDDAAKQATPQQLYQAEVLRREQQMAERITYLESQLQAQQRYQTPPPLPPYYSDSAYSDSAPFYPGYYPYAYPSVLFPTRVLRPLHTLRSRGFASGRSVAFRGGHVGGRR
jgi:hypothetical protein